MGIAKYAPVLFIMAIAPSELMCTADGDDEMSGCPGKLRAHFTSYHPDDFHREPPELVLLDTAGNEIDTNVDGTVAGGSMSVLLQENAERFLADVSLTFRTKTPIANAGYQLVVRTVSGEELVASKLGDRFRTVLHGNVLAEYPGGPCRTAPEMAVSIEVINARGRFDTTARTIDRSFYRRLAVDVDWSNLGCEIGTVRGRFLFRLDAKEIHFACRNHGFQFIDDGDASVQDAAVDALEDAALDATERDAISEADSQ